MSCVEEYEEFTRPCGKLPEVVTTVRGGAAATTMLTAAVCEPPDASFTWMEKLTVPAVVGMPEMVFPLRFMPVGKLPAEMLQLYGVTPPVALRLVE